MGARLVLHALPPASAPIADRGSDSNWFHKAPAEKGVRPCLPPARSCKQPLDYDKTLYRQHRRIENMFAKLKDWRTIAIRYDKTARNFLAGLCLAATVSFWIH